MKIFFSLLLLHYLFLNNVLAEPVAPKKLLTVVVKLENNLRPLTVLIHYREDQKYLVTKSEQVIRQYFPKIHDYFNYVPRTQVHFVFDTDSFDANGSAQVFPYNIVHLQDYPPTGDSSLIASADWLRTLLIHEYTHIITLEMTTGWVDKVRSFLGSTFKLAALNPRWYLEGIATWAESNFTGEGRLYHPAIMTSVVQLLKSPNFCQDFSCWDTPSIYPHGSAAYWLGAHFLHFVESKKPQTLSCWAKLNSHSIPFFVNKRFTNCYGENIYSAYADFKQDFLKKYDSYNCIFKDEKACKSLQNFKTEQNFFKGSLETDQYAAIVLGMGKKGSGTAAKAEQLFIYDKNKSKAYRVILPYSVEQLYQPDSKQFMISFLHPGWDQGIRTFGIFNTETKKIEFLSDDICASSKKGKIFSVTSYVFAQEKNYLCLKYTLQHWEAGIDVDHQWKMLYSFSPQDQIYGPTAIFKDNVWTIQYASKPILASYVKKEIGSFVKPQWKELKLDKKDEVIVKSAAPLEITGEKTYHPFSYFYPNHLMLEFLSSGTVSSYGLSTSLTDPRQRHDLSFLLLYNDGLDDNHSPYSGLAAYTFNPENWIAQINYLKLRFLYDQEVIERHHVQEESNFILGYEWTKRVWNITPLIKFGRSDESDPYASRKITRGSLSLSVNYLNQAPSTKLKLISLNVESGVSENKDLDTYNWNILTHREIWQWNEDFRSLLSAQYGKMNVEEGTGLRDGTFYGGGIPAVFTLSYPFPSYLLGYGNLLGTELMTAQLRQDWNFYYAFSGNGLFPFYLKSMAAIGGLEYLQGDYLYYKNATEKDPHIWSAFAGIKFATQIFFLLPVDAELIYARSLDDRRLRYNLSLSLQTSIAF